MIMLPPLAVIFPASPRNASRPQKASGAAWEGFVIPATSAMGRLKNYVLRDMTLVTQADVRKPRCFDGHRSGSVPAMSSPESDKVGAFGHAVSPLNH